MGRFQEASMHLGTELGVAELVRLVAAVLIGAFDRR
jgi:hypothetical protein